MLAIRHDSVLSLEALKWLGLPFFSLLGYKPFEAPTSSLSLWVLCGAYFCDLHVVEIFVELNYFYTQAFHVANIWRSVSFGRRLEESSSTLRSV